MNASSRHWDCLNDVRTLMRRLLELLHPLSHPWNAVHMDISNRSIYKSTLHFPPLFQSIPLLPQLNRPYSSDRMIRSRHVALMHDSRPVRLREFGLREGSLVSLIPFELLIGLGGLDLRLSAISIDCTISC